MQSKYDKLLKQADTLVTQTKKQKAEEEKLLESAKNNSTLDHKPDHVVSVAGPNHAKKAVTSTRRLEEKRRSALS